MIDASEQNSNGHRVVVIGGGFGGLQVVKHLRHAPVSVTLVDANNYHLFQPLTYQVATGALSPGDVTYPLRSLFGSDANVRVALAEVTGFDLEARKVLLESDRRHETPKALEYDTLVVAAGSSYSYFGHDEWRGIAGEVKSLESALSVRARILSALERAELADRALGSRRRDDVRDRRRWADRGRDRRPGGRADAGRCSPATSSISKPARLGSCWSRWRTGS